MNNRIYQVWNKEIMLADNLTKEAAFEMWNDLGDAYHVTSTDSTGLSNYLIESETTWQDKAEESRKI